MSLVSQSAFSAEPLSPQALAGVWQYVAATGGGQQMPAERVQQLKLTLSATQFKTQLGEQVLFDSTYTLDTAKTPAQIEMIGTEGDLKGKPALGIVKIEGETLTLCYAMPGNDRPAGFESQPGTRVTLTVWKRAEKQ